MFRFLTNHPQGASWTSKTNSVGVMPVRSYWLSGWWGTECLLPHSLLRYMYIAYLVGLQVYHPLAFVLWLSFTGRIHGSIGARSLAESRDFSCRASRQQFSELCTATSRNSYTSTTKPRDSCTSVTTLFSYAVWLLFLVLLLTLNGIINACGIL